MIPDQIKKDIQSELYAKFFSGFANPTRYKIIELLMEGEKTVSEIVDALNASQSQISNHLACLKWCGFVGGRQEGKYVYYKVTDSRVREIVSLARSIVADNCEQINCCTRM